MALSIENYLAYKEFTTQRITLFGQKSHFHGEKGKKCGVLGQSITITSYQLKCYLLCVKGIKCKIFVRLFRIFYFLLSSNLYH